MINVGKVLDEAIKKDASDIHFIIENKPMLRIARNLVPAESSEVLTEEDMNEIYDFLVKGNIEADKVFQETRKLDTILEYADLRFRVNISSTDGWNGVGLYNYTNKFTSFTAPKDCIAMIQIAKDNTETSYNASFMVNGFIRDVFIGMSVPYTSGIFYISMNKDDVLTIDDDNYKHHMIYISYR